MIKDLVKISNAFDGKTRVVKRDGKDIKIDTQEGDVPVLELIEFLKQ